MRDYESLSREYILFDLPSVEGWAYIAWAKESDPFGTLERASDGYIAQERHRITTLK